MLQKVKEQDVLLIEQKIGDNISKKIFENRIKYNLGDISAINPIIETVYGGKELNSFLNDYKDNLYIFGAGILGKEFYETFDGGEFLFKAFIDNDISKRGTRIKKLSIISLEDLAQDIKDIGIVVVNKFHYKEIIKQLLDRGFKEEQIFNFAEYYIELNHRQYFDIEYIDKHEVIDFVDCGALDGNTSMLACQWFDNVRNIWIFEPDSINIKKCKDTLMKIDANLNIINKAVWECDATLKFNETGNGMAGIDSTGEMEVAATNLDKVLKKTRNLYIKMDIEGAELEAIRGAKNIIREYQPKLAICIYHKTEDVIEIPKLLLEYNPNYSFYIRHYSLTKNETVLYAI